jgi:chorismate mutase
VIVAVRAVRGATQIEVDERDQVLARTEELVREVMASNELTFDDFISIIFTSTDDLTSAFPAYAARQIGFTDVPLLCARELDIEGSMPRVIRLLAHVDTERSKADVTHVYLHGAANLRRDLTNVHTDDPADA